MSDTVNCGRCGKSFPESEWACPTCGRPQWRLIGCSALFSFSVLVAGALGFFIIPNATVRTVFGWGWCGIGGLLLLLVVAGLAYEFLKNMEMRHGKWVRVLPAIPLLLIIPVVVWTTNTDGYNWRRTKRLNSTAACQRYLARYPKGEHTNEALLLHATDEVLRRFEAKQLITPAILPVDGDSDHKRLRLTTLGSFHLHYLCHVFQYLDAVVLDTPILDPGTRARMRDTMLIRERIDRTKAFLDYLDDAINDVRDEAVVMFWKERSTEARGGIAEIEKRIESA